MRAELLLCYSSCGKSKSACFWWALRSCPQAAATSSPRVLLTDTDSPCFSRTCIHHNHIRLRQETSHTSSQQGHNSGGTNKAKASTGRQSFGEMLQEIDLCSLSWRVYFIYGSLHSLKTTQVKDGIVHECYNNGRFEPSGRW